jgi:hypothetical protein
MAELRQIRTLRLGAPRRDQIARMAIALEDALRTAGLPRLPQGALLLVRRLDLGKLPSGASPQWLSRHIETRLQAMQLAAVPPRPDAPAVWFSDRSEALAALLATSAQDAPRAWYWAGVLPGWRPGMTMRELLPRALRQAAAEPHAAAGAAGVAALLDRLLRLDRLDAILEHLDLRHVAPVADPASVPAATAPAGAAQLDAALASDPGEAEVTRLPPPSNAIETSPPLIASTVWRAALTRWVRRWGRADRRSHWLAAHALVAVHGPAAAAQAERLITHLTAPVAPSGPTQTQTEPAVHRSSERMSSTPRAPQPAASDLEAYETPPQLDQPAPREPFQDAPPDALPSAEPWQPTRHGGLLLILPALARLEMAAADADGDLCLCLLHRIADRLKIRKDPVRQALPRPLPHTAPRSFVPPDAWHGLRLPRGADLGREHCLLAACQLVLARFLRRYARISLRRLVRRPALVHATPTHIDLRFDARWVDLELRLAGLDLDPGWVPWLGRVVSFHYDYEGQP